MSGSSKADSKDAGTGRQQSGKDKRKQRRPRQGAPGEVGRALRTVYDDTLREQVPDDFLDLLGKLS